MAMYSVAREISLLWQNSGASSPDLRTSIGACFCSSRVIRLTACECGRLWLCHRLEQCLQFVVRGDAGFGWWHLAPLSPCHVINPNHMLCRCTWGARPKSYLFHDDMLFIGAPGCIGGSPTRTGGYVDILSRDSSASSSYSRLGLLQWQAFDAVSTQATPSSSDGIGSSFAMQGGLLVVGAVSTINKHTVQATPLMSATSYTGEDSVGAVFIFLADSNAASRTTQVGDFPFVQGWDVIAPTDHLVGNSTLTRATKCCA